MGLVSHGSLEFAKDELKAPYVSASISILGNASLMICVSLDPKKSWTNGIIENSRYCRIKIDDDGKCEIFVDQLFGIIPHSFDPKIPTKKRPFNRMRSWTSPDLLAALKKVNAYLDKCRDASPV